MRRDIKLKTQFFSKKTYTYRSFRFFKKLNVYSLRNAFYFLHFFRFFSFYHFSKFILHKNIKIFNPNTLFFKKPNSFFLKKKDRKTIFNGLYNMNYVVFGLSVVTKNDSIHKNIFYDYSFFKKNFSMFSMRHNYQHYLSLQNHLSLLTLKNTSGK